MILCSSTPRDFTREKKLQISLQNPLCKLLTLHSPLISSTVVILQSTKPPKTLFFQRFKLYCQAQPRLYPSRNRINEYGGYLPSILRSLETEEDTHLALSEWVGKLKPREQTIILKEQRGWVRVLKVFQWLKSQEDYLPNVIHYNVVLRALGRAQKWDELRLCWIEMAKDGVFSTNNTYSMLVDVYAKAGLMKEALLWIKHMRQRNMYPDEVTMSTVVRVLKDMGEYDMGDKFFKDWCDGKVELDESDLDSISSLDPPISPKHFLSTELFKAGGRMPPSNNRVDAEEPVRVPKMTTTYNTLIDLYGKAGRLKDASLAFAKMMRFGVAPDTFTFNTMIFICGSHGLLSEAEALLAKMEEKRISPDTKTYNIFLSLYAEAGNIDAALLCYKKIREVGLFPDIVTHRAVLYILCDRNMVSEAETVIEEMEKADIHIDEHSLPAIIKMYAGMDLLDRARMIFEKCELEGGISSKTYAAVIDVYAEQGFWAEAAGVFFGKSDLVMRKKDVLEYNVMIKAYGMAKLYNEALSLFRSMKSSGTWPDSCTYNSIIQMLSGADLVDSARDLLKEMHEAGFKPPCTTFSAVIASCARAEDRLSDAVSLFEEMLRMGIEPNVVVYGSLIDGFAEAGKAEEALQYYQCMEESGISANQIILTSLIKAYKRVGSFEEAQKLYGKMKGLEGGPDVVASNYMIGLYADLGMEAEAKLILNELKENGQATEESFKFMMRLYRARGAPDKAIDLAQEMQELGLLKDCRSFNSVLASYCSNGQLKDCGELLHRMLTNKISPDAGTFVAMCNILEKAGAPAEAVEQLRFSFEEGKPYAKLAIITCVFTVAGLHNLALEFCNTVAKALVDLDSYAYNVAIYTYCSLEKVDEALNIFMKMRDEGLEPDIVTYINLVACYSKAGLLEGIKRIQSQLEYGDIEPNETLFKAIIEAYKNANRRDLAEMVSEVMRYSLETKDQPDSESEEYEYSEGEDVYSENEEDVYSENEDVYSENEEDVDSDSEEDKYFWPKGEWSSG